MRATNIVLISVIIASALFIWLALEERDVILFDLDQFPVHTTINIENVSIKVEVADTQKEREKGLGGRSSLALTGGLLFIFDTVSDHGIWMKGMLFPIDIIWISDNLVVVDIKKNATVNSYPKVFYPRRNARYVLEVNANFTEVRSIKVGDKVRLPSKLLYSTSN